MRLAWYAGASTALAAAVVISAFHQRANFYSAMVYLSQSNLCLMILVNLTFLIYGTFMYGLQRLCFGQLRPIETEQLYEKAWFAVTETCLAMTVFRDEVGAFFLVMFTALVTGKVWGWIGDGRVEVLEQQPPANPRLFHTRLSISLLLSILYDAWLLQYAVYTVIQQARPNMMVMFLFEFAILTVCSVQTGLRYIISLVEARVTKTQTRQRLEERRRQIREQRAEILRQRESREARAAEATDQDEEPLPDENDVDEMDIEVPGWESKGQWILSLDLLSDFMKLSIYTAFFFVLMTFYGMPIHIMRDLFMTTRSFIKRLGALMRYRQALRDMNRYADATAEDLSREDTCIICREQMRPWDTADPGQVERSRPKKLPCGHILHLGCLKSWLERQQVCPTCRRSVAVVDGNPRARNGDALVFRLGFGLPAAQNQPAPAPGVAPGNQGDQGAANDQQQPANGGLRMINIGPLRLGIAQGGARDIQDMAQRLAARGPQEEPPPRDTIAPAAAQESDTSTTSQGTSGNSRSIESYQGQLRELGQHIQQDIQALQNTQQELQTLHLLLYELHRVRMLNRQNAPLHQTQNPLRVAQPNPTPAAVTTAMPNQANVGAAPIFPPPPGQFGLPHPMQAFAPRFNPPTMTRHTVIENAAPIRAGSPDLPEGLIIPPGWSLMPLQRIDAHGAHMPVPFVHPAAANPQVNVPPVNTADFLHPRAAAEAALSDNTLPYGIRVDDPVTGPDPITQQQAGAGEGTGNGEPHSSSAGEEQRREPVQPAPTQTTPLAVPIQPTWSWGVPVQSFGSSVEMSSSPGPSNAMSSAIPPSQPAPVEPTPESGGDKSGSSHVQSAEGQNGSSNSHATEENGHAVGKGKARAATVEDADEDGGRLDS